MAVKKYKPTTPGRRGASVLVNKDLAKSRPKKSLVKPLKKKAGRNAQGKITVRHRGGGSKRLYREVDFKRLQFDIPATVKSLEYDPNRTANIALVSYQNGSWAYILAPEGLKVGDVVMSSQNKIDINIGNRMPLKYIPVGTTVYNVELQPGRGGKLARSAGNVVVLRAVDAGYAHLKLPSGEVRMVPQDCLASIGQVSNSELANVRIGKAGRVRHMGRRPQVRGKAMNPVDHAHGGGEGGASIGLKHPKTPTGKPALGVKTRKKGKPSDKLIIRRRGKRRR